MLELRFAVEVMVLAGVAVGFAAADPPAAIALTPCDGALLVLLALSTKKKGLCYKGRD